MTGITKYDSAAFMFSTLAHMLRDKPYDVSETTPKHIPPPLFARMTKMLNGLSEEKKIKLSVGVSTRVSLKARCLSEVNEEEIAREIVSNYPKRQYQAIAIGSSNGALVHLYAALGIPWLPQTNLILVNREESIEPDDMARDAAWGEEHAKLFLKNNPKIQLHQMNDPSQDRFMAIDMSYFRIKFAALPDAYKKFIEENLAPNGTIIIIDCNSQWPITKLNDRHYFQVGGYGGITIDEYLHGGPRVKAFLQKYHSTRNKFNLPKITGKYIEAEWGFEEKLLQDLTKVSKNNHYKMKRLTFTDPEDVTVPVIEFYRWWYQKLGRPTNKLLIESFLLLEPYWTIRTGCLPYWAVFTGTPTYDGIKKYLSKNTYDHIYMTLFSNIVNAVGVPRGKEWERLLHAAKKDYAMIGTDVEKFPFDLTTPYEFFSELPKKIPFRYEMPEQVSLKAFEQWVKENPSHAFHYRNYAL